MVDFSLLNKSPIRRKSKSLLDTFARLDRQVSHVELRSSQVDLFRKVDERLDERDLVLKLTTGGGKTTTGLIYLKQKMDQYEEPVVFLVPTTQLAEQVVEEGKRVGAPVVIWPQNSSYPPEEALRCTSIMVCTYDKFFNGRSTFGRSDVRLVPCALVLDDVHAGIEALRKCFSAELSTECRAELLAIFSDSLKKLEPASWARIEYGDPAGLVEVPHWVIAENEHAVRDVLMRHNGEKPLLFSWPYLSREIRLCRLVISGASAAISMDPPLVNMIDHYTKAKHRLFMSASVHDGASLIRELGCAPEAASNPVEITGEVPVGERMVLVPSLIDPEFHKESVLQLARRVLQVANVVVLVSSEAGAAFWVNGGASIAMGESFSAAVAQLKRTSQGCFTVFVNRYDGIDLPDSACRLLIIDGLPLGDGLLDRLDAENAGGVVGMRGKVANRVEQGLGRAVRSNSDYCAVILCGRELASFVSRRIVLNSFSPATVRQLDIGREVSMELTDEVDKVAGVVTTINQLLSRDEGWRGYYVAQMSGKADEERGIAEEAVLRRSVATFERSAADRALAMDYLGAARDFRAAAGLLVSDKAKRGVIKQSAARVTHIVDKVAALQLQASAYTDNFNLSRPPVMPPIARRRASSQAEQIAEWLRSFADLNGAVLAIDELVSAIRFSNGAEAVESAVQDMGTYLGAESSRPEKECGRGPDNLWVFGDKAICIELKSDKVAKLWKDDAGQIALSERWVRDNVTAIAEIYPMIGADVVFADRAEDFPANVTVITSDSLLHIISILRGMIVGLITQGPLFATDVDNVQMQLPRHELLPQQIVQLGERIRQA